MVGDQNEPPLTRFGRIALSQVLSDWSENSLYNPRMLAEQVSEAIRSLGMAGRNLNTAHLAAFMAGQALPDVQFTYDALADYFASSSVSSNAYICDSREQTYESASVLISRKWIDRITDEAIGRANFAAGLATAAGANTVAVAVNDPSPDSSQRPCTPSGSEDGFLKIGQKLGRQVGEKSAAEQLDAKNAEISRLQGELAAAQARLVTLEKLRQQDRDDADEAVRKEQEARRAKQRAEEIIAEHAGVIAFMDASNPLSPFEGRRMVVLWDEVTEGGAHDPVAEGGIGLGEVVSRWFGRNCPVRPDSTIKRYAWALGWPARKNGGAVSRPPKGKV